MLFDNIQEYYRRYIESYRPYASSLLYKRFVRFIYNRFFQHLYIHTPRLFKSMYEDHKTPAELIDRLLLSNGYPYDLISSNTKSANELIFEHFMDYNRYKGTVALITALAKVDDTKLSIFELIIDNKIINETDAKYYEGSYADDGWVFVPRLIYYDTDIKPADVVFDYDNIYYKTNQYFINRHTLDLYKSNQDIVFPTLSNLLYVDATVQEQSNSQDNLINGMVLNRYKADPVTVYFADYQFSTTFLNMYRLYYYILLLRYPTFIKYSLPALVFSPSHVYDAVTDVDLTNLLAVIDEGELISDRTEYSDYYDKYYTTPHLEPMPLGGNLPSIHSSEILSNIEAIVGGTVTTYIANSIAQASNNNSHPHLDILNDVYNSFITWQVSSSLDDDIFKRFLHTLPTDYLPFRESFLYRMLEFMKPYHIELIVNFGTTTTIKDTSDNNFASHVLVICGEGVEASVPVASSSHNITGDTFTEGICLGDFHSDTQAQHAIVEE